MSQRSTSFALLVVVVLNYVQMVSGHGWMVSPTPRGGGGTGSGNASTTSPCGNAGSATIQATWTVGQTVTVSYMRANSHGNTGPTVNFKMAIPANINAPTAAEFTTVLVTGATMDVTLNTPQSTSFVVPAPSVNFTAAATAAVQFQWTPTSGGNWFDCAFVTLLPAGGTTSCTGVTCPQYSTCIPQQNNQYTCKCDAGYANNGPNACALLPPATNVVLYLSKDVTTNLQDPFTRAIARLLGLPVSRILYDKSIYLRSVDQTQVFFAITADENGVTGAGYATNLTNIVRNADAATITSTNFGYTITSVQVEDQAAIQYGQGPANTNTNKGPSAGKKAGFAILYVIVACAAVALIAIGAFVVFKVVKKRNEKSNLNQYAANAKLGNSAAPQASRPAPPPRNNPYAAEANYQ